MRNRPVPVDFSDLGGPEAAEVADPAPRPGDPPQDFAGRVLDALREVGIPAGLTARAFVRIEAELEAERMLLAAEAVRRIALRLSGSAAAEALKRVVTGDDEPLRDAARRAGCSHVAIMKQTEKIRRRLR